MEKTFIGFIILSIIAMLLFVAFYTGYVYDTTLPGGGRLIIKWNESSKKIEMLKFFPKNNPKGKAKNMLYLEGEKEEKKVHWQ